MIFKTLLFLVLMYFLVKFIARLFLPNPQKGQGQRQSNARVFYKIFRNIREQQKRQQQQQQGGQSASPGNSGNVKSRLDQIEDAEFEEIEEEKDQD